LGNQNGERKDSIPNEFYREIWILSSSPRMEIAIAYPGRSQRSHLEEYSDCGFSSGRREPKPVPGLVNTP
jgi:hypothetical protein